MTDNKVSVALKPKNSSINEHQELNITNVGAVCAALRGGA